MTVYGTYRYPLGIKRFPAALLISGSGPTDRNGNSADLPGSIDTMQTLAQWLSKAGVASFRYDKVGTGETGMGPYSADPQSVDLAVFEHEAAGALSYLAGRPGVDTSKLMVVGHSEGALFALLLATGGAGDAPAVHSLGLIEPLSRRYLDVLREQVAAQLHTDELAGQISSKAATTLNHAMTSVIASLRSTGTVPVGLPKPLTGFINSSTAQFLTQADRFDPGDLAARLEPKTPVFVTCSDADIQVSCDDVAHLAAGLKQARAATSFSRLSGVDHVLKEDPSHTEANYTAALPFSTQLRVALQKFVASAE
jgi:acetyl esterase/lipase